MAIALDAITSGTANGTQVTFTHTLTGSELGLFLAAGIESTLGAPGTASWAGVNATLVGSITQVSAGNDTGASLFYVANPTAGAGSATIKGESGDRTLVAISFTGVNTAGQPAVVGSASGDGTTISTTVTATTANSYVIDVFASESDTTLTAGVGQIVAFAGTPAVNESVGVSYIPSVEAVSVTPTWTHPADADNNFAQVVAIIAPSVSDFVSSNIPFMLGS